MQRRDQYFNDMLCVRIKQVSEKYVRLINFAAKSSGERRTVNFTLNFVLK